MPELLSNLQHCGCELPQTRRGIERRTALLTGATELFLEKGYDNVSLDDVVQHAGGSKTTIYKYFGSKKGLLTAICEYRTGLFLLELQKPLTQQYNNLTDLLFHTLLQIYSCLVNPENTALAKLIFEQSQRDPELAQALYDLGPKRAHSKIADLLAQADANGEIFCPLPYESATFFFGIFRHAQWRAMMGLPPIEDGKNAEESMRYLVERFMQGHCKQ